MMKMLWVGLTLLMIVPMLIYVLSENMLYSYQEPETFDSPIISSQARQEQGKKAMRIRGCLSCHGEQLQGMVFADKWPWVERAVAPNLAKLARKHGVSELERVIRHGIGLNGKALWTMPSFGYVNLSDEDLTAMIAYMRSVDVIDKTLPEPKLGWWARWLLLTNQMQHSAALSTQVPALQLNSSTQPALARGEYIAMSTCNECHGRDLRGEVSLGDSFPSLLVMIKAYTQEDFIRLMSDGVGVGERADLGLMSYVAKTRFAYFSEQEVKDLYAYLNHLSESD
ncbi:c-type cytochrome [Marinicella meishanensis]|uniref:c-type cytochrome n=1 Tax=Marinicella meishanensis TaxID=2873263 RepID=UPI001CBA6BCA|nr:c-type cytochrome [Marinicella sp. NBU2979]